VRREGSRWADRSWAGPGVRGPSDRGARSEKRASSCGRRSVFATQDIDAEDSLESSAQGIGVSAAAEERFDTIPATREVRRDRRGDGPLCAGGKPSARPTFATRSRSRSFALPGSGPAFDRSARQTYRPPHHLAQGALVAVDWELLPFVPKVKWLKGAGARVRLFRLRRVANGSSRPPMSSGGRCSPWAVRTALRIGELRALQWDDVDLVVGRLVVRRNVWRGHPGTPKSGRNREIPLCDDALNAMKASGTCAGDRPLRGRRPSTRGERVQVAHLASLQARWPAAHQLARPRHTFASHLVMKGRAAQSGARNCWGMRRSR